MAAITVIVKNESDEAQKFMIFNEPPEFSSSTGKAWTNVWGRSPGVGAKNGQTDFTFTEQYYAVCGMAAETLRTDLEVKTTDSLEMTLGTKEHPATVANVIMVGGGVIIDKTDIGTLDKKGAYGIYTSEYDLTRYKDAFCGVGLKSLNPLLGAVSPVAVWQAKPNQQYQITPKRRYFISTGEYKPGKIVDVTQLGRIAKIDFTGRSENVAIVTLNNELAYETVQYAYSDKLAAFN